MMVVGGLHDDYKKGRSPLYFIFGIMSGAFIFIFVLSYFNSGFANNIGIWMVPMAVLGSAWEFYITAKEISQIKPDPDLSEKENKWIEHFAIIGVNLFVVPGYYIGFVLSYKAIKRIL